MQQAFRGRKKDPTQNVMVAVNCDLKFTYVLAGWEGSAHDATVLADAVARADGLSVPVLLFNSSILLFMLFMFLQCCYTLFD
jgi:hypothetical protein